jgi:hypothetical protein
VTASGKALESTVIRHRVEDFIAGEVVDLAGGETRPVAGHLPWRDHRR